MVVTASHMSLPKRTVSKCWSLFVCGISLTFSQFVNELFPDCTRPCFPQVALRHRGGEDEMRCLFVAVGPIPPLYSAASLG